MDKAAERRARRAAAARARRRDPDVRAREAEARREAARRRRQDPGVREREAEAARQRRQAAREDDLQAVRQREATRKRAYRRANEEVRVREAAAKRAKKEHEVGETLPAADGVKAQTVRVHRTGRSWPLVMCPHHSTSEAEALGVATADFSAVFPDIDFKQAAEVACDKPPFIEDSLVSTTCRVEPWRGLQDKCVGEYEAVLQHAERFCQTEHHITLVQCRKPQVSTCSVEVQADPWCQHHCGIGPIGVDLCET
ncbi:uncharacterized protein LOC119453068 isoform X17 [Dermacentor silvarum]|uniref:uncharacterized protein LOC119453068 isoform X17 n=1 Tax=Dermacentor silvarum TaxID=543639 RepID=UPI002100827E|nr:uncharacterized protein LOC119453068 isoform X17 [Dermacentor silvarum]